MRFGTAIERLVDNYRYAKSKFWIRDEVAWALYHTWKEADDRKTEPQTKDLYTDKDGDVWEWRGDSWYCISGDEPQTDCCETCKHKDDGWDSKACDPCSRVNSNYEPQTEREGK